MKSRPRSARSNILPVLAAFSVLSAGASSPADARPTDPVAANISALRHEGLQGSQVMDHMSWLADVYGPRMSGTPALTDASDWAMRQATRWGLVNVHREHFPFGAGWSLEKSAIRMVAPQPMQIIGYPISWTPGTDGPVRAEVVNAVIRTESDFALWRGRLRGKAVLLQPAVDVAPIELPLFYRFSDADLQALEEDTSVGWQWLAGAQRDGSKRPVHAVPEDAGRSAGLYGVAETEANNRWFDALLAFLKSEGVVAVIERGADTNTRPATSINWLIPRNTQRVDGGTVFTPTALNTGLENQQRLLPWLVIAVEQYNRMVRILRHDVAVTIELDIGVRWHPETGEGNGFNTLAELPGTDLAAQTVIVGAHLDGVHTASAAIDNAAGVAIAMEAMRLLSRLEVKPRRTIRMALWGGEENALVGSRAYVVSHYGDPFGSASRSKAAQRVSAYFNVDNGAGRIRGLFARNNLAAMPILRNWIEPLRDLGVTTISPRATATALSQGRFVSGSDYLYFDAAGIPSFEMIQDPLDYFSRGAHSNMDYLDRAPPEDMIQASVALAVLAYQAAMADDPLPRRALPRREDTRAPGDSTQ